MNHCVNDLAARKHAHEESILDDFQSAVTEKHNELMAGEYHPFKDDHFMHAIGEMSPQMTELVCQVAQAKNYHFLGEIIANHVINFWSLEAYKQTIKELELCQPIHQ